MEAPQRDPADDRLQFRILAHEDGEAARPLPPVQPQPTPEFAIVNVMPDGSHTVITRGFLPGQSRFCRRCPSWRCRTIRDVCAVRARGVVADQDAIEFVAREEDFLDD